MNREEGALAGGGERGGGGEDEGPLRTGFRLEGLVLGDPEGDSSPVVEADQEERLSYGGAVVEDSRVGSQGGGVDEAANPFDGVVPATEGEALDDGVVRAEPLVGEGEEEHLASVASLSQEEKGVLDLLFQLLTVPLQDDRFEVKLWRVDPSEDEPLLVKAVLGEEGARGEEPEQHRLFAGLLQEEVPGEPRLAVEGADGEEVERGALLGGVDRAQSPFGRPDQVLLGTAGSLESAHFAFSRRKAAASSWGREIWVALCRSLTATWFFAASSSPRRRM
ncbi:MAG: hypothetical protein BWY86_01014 [Candidatus Aminicenantes bacterium ADurb.Bin508]|nr:MAG: hypothetical protein BWY86_01014 [Candidatus Aminicenantes bacterium ADurb.Bin508]